MYKSVRLLWIIGLFGLVAAANANAQTPSPSPPVTKYDGKYAFVSGTKVNDTYTAGTGRAGPCPGNKKARALTIMNGQARLFNGPNYYYKGTVGPQGQLAMRLEVPASCSKCSLGVEIEVSGTVDGDGTIRARRTDYRCAYDLIWQKAVK